MPPPTDPMVLTLRSPADVLEAVPYLLGFQPADSLVVLGLRGPRRRLGVTVRLDLVGATEVHAVAAHLTGALRADRSAEVILVAYGSEPDPDPLVRALRERLVAANVSVSEALRVVGGRWTSYLCANPGCCPPQGTPVPDRVDAPGRVGAAAVLAGRQVLTDRATLAATLAPVVGVERAAMTAALDRELERRAAVEGPRAQPTYALGTVELVRARLGSALEDRTAPALSTDDAARLIVGMHDVAARDACLDGFPAIARDIGTERPALELPAALRPGAGPLWAELMRRAVRPGLVAPVATLFAWNAYIHHGGGASMTIALERALDDVPDYVMAQGLLALLGGGVMPSQFAGMVAGADGRRPGRRRSRAC